MLKLGMVTKFGRSMSILPSLHQFSVISPYPQNFCDVSSGIKCSEWLTRFHVVQSTKAIGRHRRLSNGTSAHLSKAYTVGGANSVSTISAKPHRATSFAASATTTSNAQAEAAEFRESPGDTSCFYVLNFYRFTAIEDPHEEVDRHRQFLAGRDIHCRVYINEQGINAQLSGPFKDLEAYAMWVQSLPHFSGVYLQFSPSPRGHAFPRFKLRYKASLVQVAGGTSNLPVLNQSEGAIALTPDQWRARLEGSRQREGDRKVLLLDVRNGYEWDVGHFEGACRPPVDNFRETRFGIEEGVEPQPGEVEGTTDPLAGVDKENTDVLMYCTGGIRCDVYSTILRSHGYQNLFSLKGGVAHYLREEGAKYWNGNLFVFDSRLAVPAQFYKAPDPTNLDPSVLSGGDSCQPETEKVETVFAPTCSTCGSQLPAVRHRNCANLDCNKLFLVCSTCAKESSGCCSGNCQLSPRIRPFLEDSAPYGRWHNYRPDVAPARPAGLMTRRAFRRQMRKQKRMQEIGANSIQRAAMDESSVSQNS